MLPYLEDLVTYVYTQFSHIKVNSKDETYKELSYFEIN